MTTIREAWQFGRAKLIDSPTPVLDARLLLEYVLGRDHAYLIAHDDDAIPHEVLAAYQQLLDRAAVHEPIPYLTGKAPFMGLYFTVSHDVLIPRPETEQLVEMAIEWGKSQAGIRAIDVGTGSGCIGVTLARFLPQATVAAVDISAAALALAAINVSRHVPGRVMLVRGNLLEAIAPGIDLIVANLPYIAGHEWPTLAVGVKSYEPALALDGGADGLDLFRKLLPQAAARLKPGGLILLEIGWRQGDAVAALARESLPGASVTVRPDFAGHNRVVMVQNSGG